MSQAIQTTVDDIEALVEEKVKEQTADLREENERLREENERLRERVDELENSARVEWEDGDHKQMMVVSADGERYPVGRAIESKISETELEERLDDLRDRLDEGDLSDAGNSDPDVPRETALEDVVALPDEVAERELNANVQRARWFASRVTSAGKKTPSGYHLSAGQIGRLLDVAVDGAEPHPETVARIISILDDLGDDTTTRRKRNGEKRIIIDQAAAKRLKAHSGMSREE